MKKIKEKVSFIINGLKDLYPDAKCSLNYSTPHELLIATRLSAQCTDARVNIVTEGLFSKYDTLEKFANAEIADVENIIKSCGLFKTKAKDIVNLSKMLISEFNGIVPDEIEDLLKLPGIGRKTANLIVGDIYHKSAIVTDTHCIRITNRLGLSDSTNPLKVEKQLRIILPPNESNDFCHRLVLFGRDICKARKPECEICAINSHCDYYIGLNSSKNALKKDF